MVDGQLVEDEHIVFLTHAILTNVQSCCRLWKQALTQTWLDSCPLLSACNP